MNAVLYKVYCYRGSDKQIWFEIEDMATGQGVAWSPSRSTVVKKANKLGYRQRALTELRRAMTLDPGEKEAERILRVLERTGRRR